MNDERADGGDETEQGGVFGNLPASRPGTRSPRRDGATKARAKPAEAKATASASRRKPPAARERPAAREPVGADEPQGEQAGGLDDLAWAGIAAVAEAATLGVRLANRALGALRDGVDRR